MPQSSNPLHLHERQPNYADVGTLRGLERPAANMEPRIAPGPDVAFDRVTVLGVGDVDLERGSLDNA